MPRSEKSIKRNKVCPENMDHPGLVDMEQLKKNFQLQYATTSLYSDSALPDSNETKCWTAQTEFEGQWFMYIVYNTIILVTKMQYLHIKQSIYVGAFRLCSILWYLRNDIFWKWKNWHHNEIWRITDTFMRLFW